MTRSCGLVYRRIRRASEEALSWETRSFRSSLAVAKRTVWPSRTALWATFWASVVLPTPFGPMKTTFEHAAVSLSGTRKSSVRSSSTRLRSSRLGHVQSKSARSLKRPILAVLIRRSRLRRPRAASSRSIRAGNHDALAYSAQWARTPYSPSLVARSRSSSEGLVIVANLPSAPCDRVVGPERVRPDTEVAHSRVVGKSKGECGGETASPPLALEDLPDGVNVGHVALEHLANGSLERLSAVGVEEQEEPGRRVAKVLATLGEALEERSRARRDVGETAHAAALVRLSLRGDERRDVRGILDRLPLVVGAPVSCDLLGAVEHPHHVERRHNDERPPDELVRHGVVVPVEAHVGRLLDSHLAALVGREGRAGQREELLALLLVRFAHRDRRVLGPRSVHGLAAAPLLGLLVQVVEVAPVARDVEAAPDEANGPLDSRLLVAAVRRDRPRLVTVMGGELEQERVEPDRVSDPLEDGALEVVIETDPRDALPELERPLVAAKEVLGLLPVEEPHVGHARVREHPDERDERAVAAPDPARSEVRPVELSLLPWERLEAQECLRRLHRTEGPHRVPEVVLGAGIAALAAHDPEPARRKRRPFPPRLADEGNVQVDDRRPRLPELGRVRVAEHALDHVVVDAELRRDRPHRPLLGDVETQDPDLELARDHGALPALPASRPSTSAMTPRMRSQEAPSNEGTDDSPAEVTPHGLRQPVGTGKSMAHLHRRRAL